MADELLTVAEAAQKLGVSIPRLRRWLARPENASFSSSVQRQTRTGIRTAAVVSITVLPQILDAVKQEREQVSTKSLAEENLKLAYLEVLLQEKDARILDLTETLKYEREQCCKRKQNCRKRKFRWFQWLDR